MKKKLLALALVAILVIGCVSVFTACSGNDNFGSEFKVGVLHINPKDSTSGYTYAHQQGILEAQKNLGLKDSQIVLKDNIDDTNTAMITTAIDELIAEGCTMIIGTSFGYFDEMESFAQQYPHIIFSHGTGPVDTFGEGKNNNMNNYFGRIYQVRYLSGVVAGLKAKELGNPNIGYVSAQDFKTAECSSGVNAFALGAQSVYPDAKVYVQVLNSWFDPANETAYAENLLKNKGCGIVTQHCDTENPSAVASKEGKYSIGYNSDMGIAIKGEADRNPSVLTSVLWHWGVYYTDAIREAMKCYKVNEESGKVEFVDTKAWEEFGNYYKGIEADLFGLAPLSSEVAADTQAYVDAVTKLMKDGAWDVFNGKKLTYTVVNGVITAVPAAIEGGLKDNQGNVVAGVEGKEITDVNIKADMPWWVAGVEQI